MKITKENIFKKFYIHCPTQEEFNNVVQRLVEIGFSWRGEEKKINEYHWGRYKIETCVGIEDRKICFGNISYCEEEMKLKKITAKEFLKKRIGKKEEYFSEEYPLGDMVEPVDIEKEKRRLTRF